MSRFEEVWFDGVEEMLADARSRLDRVEACTAYREVACGDALLVDIRPEAQRKAEGEVHPELRVRIVERNVLEWRFDPRSSARLPEAAYDARVIVLCQEGYTSSLAADALQRLGLHRATDLVGGFKAWREAGLPATRGRSPNGDARVKSWVSVRRLTQIGGLDMTGRIASARTHVDAPVERVWDALLDPDAIEKYMFGSRVETDWKPGSPIRWAGEFEGRRYEDRGLVLEVVPEQRLAVTHFSPLSGQEDQPENYHTLTYELEGSTQGTDVRLTQDNAGSPEEADHSAQNWQAMLDKLKDVVEER